MAKKLEGKVALVTGAGSGIGRATAILFAKEGAKVVVADISSEGGAKTVEMIRKDGGNAMFVQADVSKARDVKKMIEKAVEKFDRLDILFNNAGILETNPVSETTEEQWDRTMNINLKGVFLGSKYAIPQMMKQGGGVIINTASECGVSGFPGYGAYGASKAAVYNLTKVMAAELAPKIRVNSISPGRIYTPMQSGRTPKDSPHYKQVIKAVPMGRWGKAEDIAYAALYLASDESSYVTGANLAVDGGTTCSIYWPWWVERKRKS